ncbi:MAG: DEAD/DEAH box helicase [Alphaproteobacteria bacterium]|nr:DEAD/DEAH box helicase [Alphaproteobacteria bacterium]
MTEPRNPPSETGTDGFEGDPFFELGLAPTIVDDAAAAGLLTPTPIQRAAIPAMLTGQDLIGLAQTGTGKTAAYLLPLLHRLLDRKKAKDVRSTSTLVLAPTRELAYQIAESVKTLSSSLKLRYLVICGGERYDHQIRSLKKGVDMIIATPGRLEDLQARGAVKLHEIEHFVLDEGDQMIDLGFYPAIKRILASLPDTRQTVLFSATMPEEMRKLAEGFLRDPVTVKVENAGQTVDTISQRALLAHNVDKRDLLVRELEAIEDGQVLVFVRTRMRADELAEWLGKQGIGVDALHGDMRQYIRQKVIRKFKTGTLKVLVATDVAARGIDMSGLRLVINFDLPETVDTYIHRIGRTGRAGREGEALSICAVVDQEKLAAILAKVGDRLVITDSDGNVVDDFVPERSPRARKGRGRPPRGQRQPGRPATARANKRPTGKPSGKPSGKSFSGKPSFDGKKKKSGGKHAAQDAGASQGPKKPYSDKPRSDRPRSDKPQSDRPRNDKPYAGKPKHGKQNAGKSHAGKHDAGNHKNAGNERVDRPAGASDGQDGAPSRQRLTKARLNQSPKRGGKPPAKGAGRGADKRTGKGPSAQRLRGGGEGRLRRRRTG